MYFADLAGALTNFSVLASVIATLSAIVLGILSAKNKITTVALRESNDAYKSLHETDKLQIQVYNEENKSLKARVKALEEIKTQAPSINKLTLQLAEQHKDMISAMASMTQELGNVARAVMAKEDHDGKRNARR